jgi:hypothetical protein
VEQRHAELRHEQGFDGSLLWNRHIEFQGICNIRILLKQLISGCGTLV